MSGNEEKNPYAFKRNIGAAATLVALLAYFFIPATMAAVRMAVLMVFFVLISVLTYFQQQYRGWVEAQRTPDDYDEDGRLKKYSRSRK